MKNFIAMSLFAAFLLTTGGCISYSRRTVEPVVVSDAPVVTTDRVVTVLPTGYKTYTTRGTTYYYYKNYYYRTAPGGYVVTTVRPW